MTDPTKVRGANVAEKFRITDYIGDGAFGWVFKAEQMTGLRGNAGPAAVKILKNDVADAEELLSEAKKLEACEHDHVIALLHSGMNHCEGPLQNQIYLAMELADESLEARLKSGPLSTDETRTLAMHICSGLAHVHGLKKVHRDLKPANVLRVGEIWKLSDFGILRDEGYLHTRSRIGGTPAYTPPEGLSNTLAPSFDMWSLGCLLHECLTGKLPPRDKRDPNQVKVDRSLPEPFYQVINACLKNAPGKRPSAVACIAMLDPTATPFFLSYDSDESDCFLCFDGSDCALPLLTGTLAGVEKVGGDYACLVYSDDHLEAQRLLLTETWARELGERLHADWKAFNERPYPVTLSALHVYAHKDGYRANDESLVVLDPDWLVSATDLRSVHACERIRLVDRYKTFQQNKYVILGNVVHELLKDIWDSADASAQRREKAIARQMEQLARVSGNDDALGHVRSKIDEHVQRLGAWTRKMNQRGATLRAETTVIAPEVGLQGRIDAIWFRDDERVALGELKTGSRNDEDVLQLSSYGLMLASRNEVSRDIRSMLLYSKPPYRSEAGVEERVPLDRKRFREAIVARNKVLLVDSSTNARFNEGHCHECRSETRSICKMLTHLSGHTDPRSPRLRDALTSNERALLATVGPDERAFFQEHEAKILEEMRAVKSQAAWLWSRTSQQRERAGLALRFRKVVAIDTSEPPYRYGLMINSHENHSQIGVEDRVYLSDLDGPTQGRLLQGTVVDVDYYGIVVECDEPLPFEEGWASGKIDEKLIVREFIALYQWLMQPTSLRDVIVKRLPPTFRARPEGWKQPVGAALNAQQKKAVEMSVRADDYLLILGPPGAGKTTLLAALVQAQLDLGRRVLVSANSNRALDQVVRTLIKGGLQNDVLRLGRLKGMADDVRVCALDRCHDAAASLEHKIDAIREACESKRVVAATASSLANGDFDPLLGAFDLVVIDEATQVSLPLSLGPLRYASRCVLVGDPNQLAPIRVSREIGQPSEPSLFEVLAQRVRDSGGEGMVQLNDQYRMNAEICRVPSEMWYDNALRPGTPEVERARLSVNPRKLPADVKKVLDPKHPVVFVDVPSDLSHAVRVNQEEARWAVTIVKALHDCDPSWLDSEKANDRLGVIAPYRAQVACIRRELNRVLPNVETRHWVDTVDRFQGGERDVMIFSLVGAGGGDVPEHLRDPRRLNVALSRARHKLVLIGDHDALQRHETFSHVFDIMADIDKSYRLRLGAL